MRKFLYVSIVMIVLGFVGEKAFAHKDKPGVPVEPEAQLNEVLGKSVCVVDNFGSQYNLILDDGTISGTVDTLDCGHYSHLTGSYIGLSFTFHTGDPDAWWLGCRGYQVDGTVDIHTKTASGRYVTDGGFGSGPKCNRCATFTSETLLISTKPLLRTNFVTQNTVQNKA